MEKVKLDALAIMALAKEISQEQGSTFENALQAVKCAIIVDKAQNDICIQRIIDAANEMSEQRDIPIDEALGAAMVAAAKVSTKKEVEQAKAQ